MRVRRLLSALTLCAAAVLPVPAYAASSIAGGGLVGQKTGGTGFAALISSGTSVPSVPLAVQGSVIAGLSGAGGYAATVEVRGLTGGGYGGAYVGAGAGFGDLTQTRSAPVFTVFAGKSIAPLTSLELRVYKQTQDEAAVTAGFIGLRFSF